jgi:ubiquitin carboxyl-terminal hydrolase 12/46
LVNVANTCYANSVLQALYFCVPFRKAILRHLNEEREEDANEDSLLMSLAELFGQIESQKRSVGVITPRRFLQRLRKANDLFCTSEHQDAHEFMEFLLNDIVETVAKRILRQREREKGVRPKPATVDRDEQPEEEPQTWVHDIFQGYLVNQMKCRCCESVTVRRENFLDLSVDIERHCSTAACLRAFESTELLRSENKFFCDTCGCLQEAEKRLRVYQLPSVLTLHLKRFKYVERLGRCCRLPYRVVFPLQLQVVEHQPTRNRGGRGGNACGTNGRPGDNEVPSEKPTRVFELRSVVVHIGRDSSRGHYVTVVRTGDSRCVLLDDDVVRQVEPEVLRSFYGTANDTIGSGGACGGGELGERRTGGSHGGDRHSGDWHGRPPAPPLYERSPEGTCCGYILFYEAVDGASPLDKNATVDIGAASEWISEECQRTDSDSDISAEGANDPGSGHGLAARGPRPSSTEDGELIQVFEQRCIPNRGHGGRGWGAPASPAASPTAPSQSSATP